MTQVNLLTPQQAQGVLSSALFLDVRTPMEYNEARIDGSVLHPLGELNPDQVKQLNAGKKRCVIVCRSGGRARQAYELLAASGMSDLAVLDGGVMAWDSQGLPLLRGSSNSCNTGKAISLERQVRIAAGALVVMGVMLGVIIHPLLLALAAFVGAGLVFSGVTDSCGLALVLAKMPWNRS